MEESVDKGKGSFVAVRLPGEDTCVRGLLGPSQEAVSATAPLAVVSMAARAPSRSKHHCQATVADHWQWQWLVPSVLASLPRDEGNGPLE